MNIGTLLEICAEFKWDFPKIRGTIWGVPIIRTIVFWGLYWGSLILGNYHIGMIMMIYMDPLPYSAPLSLKHQLIDSHTLSVVTGISEAARAASSLEMKDRSVPAHASNKGIHLPLRLYNENLSVVT